MIQYLKSLIIKKHKSLKNIKK